MKKWVIAYYESYAEEAELIMVQAATLSEAVIVMLRWKDWEVESTGDIVGVCDAYWSEPVELEELIRREGVENE